MVWTTNEPRRRVRPYCVIREAEKRGHKRYELVITYGADVRSVERFTTAAQARRRADEWFEISHRPLIFTTRRLRAYFVRPFTLRRAWVALAVRPFDALGNWVFGREAEPPVAESRDHVPDASEEEPQ